MLHHLLFRVGCCGVPVAVAAAAVVVVAGLGPAAAAGLAEAVERLQDYPVGCVWAPLAEAGRHPVGERSRRTQPWKRRRQFVAAGHPRAATMQS